jgi:signal recognition particle receptor subunit beta
MAHAAFFNSCARLIDDVARRIPDSNGMEAAQQRRHEATEFGMEMRSSRARMWSDQQAASGPPSTFGAPLQRLREEVGHLATRLKPFLSETESAELDHLLGDLDRTSCRIAVLGQVKAGKSSLVNALIRRPGLSPTNINPWTAVVCHLNFGVPSSPIARAVFTFFDEADWSYLASGGRLKELCDKLDVPVDEALLREHLENTRKRAEQRLGRQFYHLLGQEHRFARPSADLLARYVSIGSGDEVEGRRRAQAGRYSDVTKSAALYFERTPFAYPTTIIDTPGTNDPFLVRDDLTGKAVEGADIYVIVLTAEQAFSTADLAMLRMLHGLHKQRMVVFVNRIDVLDDIPGDTARIVNHVRQQLVAEFPGIEIPVVADSALLAEFALARGEIESSADLPRALLERTANPEVLGVAADTRETDEDHEEQRVQLERMIMAAAGIEELEAVLGALALEGPAMAGLNRAMSTLIGMHGDCESRAQNELRTLEQAIQLARREEQSARDLALQLDQLTQAKTRLDEVCEPIPESLGLVRKAMIGRMKFALNEVVRRFAESECEAMRTDDKGRSSSLVWQCDTRPLRGKLGQTYLEIYRRGSEELQATERDAWESVEAIFNELLADRKIRLKGQRAQIVDSTPSISGLGETVALDLGSQWNRWWHRWQTRETRIRRFKELILAEFTPIVDGLLSAADRQLGERGTASVDHFTRARKDLLGLLATQRQYLDRVRQALGRDDNPAIAGSLIEGYERKRDRVRSQFEQCRAIGAELESVAARPLAQEV